MTRDRSMARDLSRARDQTRTVTKLLRSFVCVNTSIMLCILTFISYLKWGKSIRKWLRFAPHIFWWEFPHFKYEMNVKIHSIMLVLTRTKLRSSFVTVRVRSRATYVDLLELKSLVVGSPQASKKLVRISLTFVIFHFWLKAKNEKLQMAAKLPFVIQLLELMSLSD